MFCRKFGRYCGKIPAWTLYGTNRTIFVQAVTDADVAKYGFRAVYQVSVAWIRVFVASLSSDPMLPW